MVTWECTAARFQMCDAFSSGVLLGSATRCGLTATITSMIGEQSLLRSSSPGLKPERFPSALRGAEAPLFHSTACPAREAASWRSDRALRVATESGLRQVQQYDIRDALDELEHRFATVPGNIKVTNIEFGSKMVNCRSDPVSRSTSQRFLC